MDKVKAKMNNVVQSATGYRDKLEQHYKKELAEAKKVIHQERVARQQLEQTLESPGGGGGGGPGDD
eukprot:6014573-Amphidinium_carterae.1